MAVDVCPTYRTRCSMNATYVQLAHVSRTKKSCISLKILVTRTYDKQTTNTMMSLMSCNRGGYTQQ